MRDQKARSRFVGLVAATILGCTAVLSGEARAGGPEVVERFTLREYILRSFAGDQARATLDEVLDEVNAEMSCPGRFVRTELREGPPPAPTLLLVLLRQVEMRRDADLRYRGRGLAVHLAAWVWDSRLGQPVILELIDPMVQELVGDPFAADYPLTSPSQPARIDREVTVGSLATGDNAATEVRWLAELPASPQASPNASPRAKVHVRFRYDESDLFLVRGSLAPQPPVPYRPFVRARYRSAPERLYTYRLDDDVDLLLFADLDIQVEHRDGAVHRIFNDPDNAPEWAISALFHGELLEEVDADCD